MDNGPLEKNTEETKSVNKFNQGVILLFVIIFVTGFISAVYEDITDKINKL